MPILTCLDHLPGACAAADPDGHCASTPVSGLNPRNDRSDTGALAGVQAEDQVADDINGDPSLAEHVKSLPGLEKTKGDAGNGSEFDCFGHAVSSTRCGLAGMSTLAHDCDTLARDYSTAAPDDALWTEEAHNWS